MQVGSTIFCAAFREELLLAGALIESRQSGGLFKEKLPHQDDEDFEVEVKGLIAQLEVRAAKEIAAEDLKWRPNANLVLTLALDSAWSERFAGKRYKPEMAGTKDTRKEMVDAMIALDAPGAQEPPRELRDLYTACLRIVYWKNPNEVNSILAKPALKRFAPPPTLMTWQAPVEKIRRPELPLAPWSWLVAAAALLFALAWVGQFARTAQMRAAVERLAGEQAEKCPYELRQPTDGGAKGAAPSAIEPAVQRPE